MAELTSSNVRDLFLDCLFKDNELHDGKPIAGVDMIAVEGVISNVGFHKGRVESHRNAINALLDELNPNFKEGWSFLQVPFDKHDNQWGEHQNAEQLICLGLAIGRVKCLMPRDMWSVLPGGMPYYQVLEAASTH